MKKVIFIAILSFLGMIYVGGTVFFSSHFLPNTKINGEDYSFKSPEYVLSVFAKQSEESTLRVFSKEKEVILPLKDIDYQEVVEEKQVKKVLASQSPISWGISFFQEHNYKVNAEKTYNADKMDALKEKVLSSVDGQKMPEDAKIVQGEDGSFSIAKEVYGDKINEEVIKEKLVEAISSGEDLDMEKAKVFVQPKIFSTDADLNAKIEKLNLFKNMVITYDFKDRKEELRPENFISWIEVKDGEIIVDENKALVYVSELAAKYDTYRTKRKFKTVTGKEIEVGGGIYGWQTDIQKTTQNLVTKIKEGQSVTIEPDYSIRGYERATNDIGGSYIEVNLTTQQLWLFKDGKQTFSTPIVSGAPVPGRETPTGVYNVWSREKDRFLEGETYKVKVKYWMPFDWTGCGLHDAYWQPSFGGERYKWAGSNGCLNLPLNAVETIYNSVTTGYPVIVYK